VSVGRGAMSWAQSLWKQYDPINRIMFPAQGRTASYDVKGTPAHPPNQELPRHATHHPSTARSEDFRSTAPTPTAADRAPHRSAGKPFVGELQVRDVVYKTIVVHMPVHVPGRHVRAPGPHRGPVHDRPSVSIFFNSRTRN
jgi:hypothetical protein